jgi:DNA-binding protein H-NS
MISPAMLDALQDDDLRGTKSLIDEILQKRDKARKAKALEQAKAIDARALEEKRAVLAAAGLPLRALGGNGKKKTSNGPVYHSGRTYQHPTNKALIWNAKGKKPAWLVELEGRGGKATEVPAVSESVASTGKKAS